MPLFTWLSCRKKLSCKLLCHCISLIPHDNRGTIYWIPASGQGQIDICRINYPPFFIISEGVWISNCQWNQGSYIYCLTLGTIFEKKKPDLRRTLKPTSKELSFHAWNTEYLALASFKVYVVTFFLFRQLFFQKLYLVGLANCNQSPFLEIVAGV